jgi:hypothetical protein
LQGGDVTRVLVFPLLYIAKVEVVRTHVYHASNLPLKKL